MKRELCSDVLGKTFPPVLGYMVSADGTVGDIEVLEANPVQVFTRIATNALASWRFTTTGAPASSARSSSASSPGRPSG